MNNEKFVQLITELRNLKWGEVFYLVEHYQPTVNFICSLLDVTPGKYVDMKAQKALGLFPTIEIDCSKYQELFANGSNTFPKVKTKKNTKAENKQVSVFFDQITVEPQYVEDLNKELNLSWNTIRQHKRFDPFPERGKVRISSKDGKKIIWRITNDL